MNCISGRWAGQTERVLTRCLRGYQRGWMVHTDRTFPLLIAVDRCDNGALAPPFPKSHSVIAFQSNSGQCVFLLVFCLRPSSDEKCTVLLFTSHTSYCRVRVAARQIRAKSYSTHPPSVVSAAVLDVLCMTLLADKATKLSSRPSPPNQHSLYWAQ